MAFGINLIPRTYDTRYGSSWGLEGTPALPTSVSVTAAVAIVVEFSKDHFATIAGTRTLAAGTVAKATDGKAVTVTAQPVSSKLYYDSEYRIKADGVVVGTGRLMRQETAAKAARRRK